MGGKSGGWGGAGSGGGLGGGGRSTPRSNFSPIVPMGGPGGMRSSLGAGLTSSEAPSLFKRETRDGQGVGDGDEGGDGDGDVKMKTEDAYSDPEDGVEIIDIDDVRRMDWMAPESLAKERNGDKNRKKGKNKKVKEEVDDERDKGKVKGMLFELSRVESKGEGEGSLSFNMGYVCVWISYLT